MFEWPVMRFTPQFGGKKHSAKIQNFWILWCSIEIWFYAQQHTDDTVENEQIFLTFSVYSFNESKSKFNFSFFQKFFLRNFVLNFQSF